MAKAKEASTALTPQDHSNVVGGSTAERVMNCSISKAICDKMPFKDEGSSYAREGSMLHAAIAEVISMNKNPDEMLGFEFEGVKLTEALIGEMLEPAVEAFDDILDGLEDMYGASAEVLVEQKVSFGKYIPGAFGSCDIITRVGTRVVVLDWKFGRGVPVSVEENYQLMYYTCAALRTPALDDIFKGATEFEMVIVQPSQGEPSRCMVTKERLAQYDKALKEAAVESERLRGLTKDLKIEDFSKPEFLKSFKQGKHCRWCNAQAMCPLMNKALVKATTLNLEDFDVEKLGLAVEQSYILETFIEKLRATAHKALEEGMKIPGCKLVQKRATRKWAIEDGVKIADQILVSIKPGMTKEKIDDIGFSMFKTEILSVAQMEKLLKNDKISIPEALIVSVSSGTTLALEGDPRPAVVVEGQKSLANAIEAFTEAQPAGRRKQKAK